MIESAVFGVKDESVEYVGRHGAYGVAIRGDTVLIEMARLGYFLPGGGVEAHETIEHALHREFAEETGYEISSIQEIGVAIEYQHDVYKGESLYVKKVGHFYLVELGAQSEPTYADGHVYPVVWLPISSVQEKMYLPSQWWAIERVAHIAEISVHP